MKPQFDTGFGKLVVQDDLKDLLVKGGADAFFFQSAAPAGEFLEHLVIDAPDNLLNPVGRGHERVD